MVIITIVSAVGITGLMSRWRTAKLESAAQQMLSSLTAARSSAMYKNCPTRIIFCADAACNNRDAAEATSGDHILVNDTPARFYAVLRMAYYGVTNNQRSCWFNGADPSPALIAGWDFDSRPVAIPNEVRIQPIYLDLNQMNEDVWTTVNVDDSGSDSAQATNSLWFPSSSAGLSTTGNMRPMIPANVPVEDPHLTNGRLALVQLKLDDCDPGVEEDCLAYIIAAGAGGEMELLPCEPGTSGDRQDGTNQCY
jgi:type II secretory pathway pseudopilin PulG